MNIKNAKKQIYNAMKAYFAKDENGEYIIPIERQRPVFLMGPPGIGKTAIMEQVAAEMGVGILSYSMTHHTRQSALGLPFIERKTYQGKEYDISEYTMSEIIASVYDMMEETGVKEGILFLDEINCVSETLAPIMLQFFHYNVFGRHRVPKGWIVVTAGNPPEYNNSVREFDIVTWDRLKRIDVEPDCKVWKEYAYDRAGHPAVITYLEIKKGDFYQIETTVDGKSFVTARGWDDLSQMIRVYEMQGIDVDGDLISQYLQNKKIAKSFANYYDLFNKYRSDYQVDTILAGKASDEIKSRAKAAKFDERLSLMGLIIDACTSETRAVFNMDNVVRELLNVLKNYKMQIVRPESFPSEIMISFIEKERTTLESGTKSGSISAEGRREKALLIKLMEKMLPLTQGKSGAEAFKAIKAEFDKTVKETKKQAQQAESGLSNALLFCEESFGEGQEILILITEFTSNTHTAQFIGKFGCKEYFKHNKELLFYDRQQELMRQIAELDE